MNWDWDLKEFRRLCAKRRVRDTTDYVNTVTFKQWRVDYFSDRSLEVWKKLFSSGQVVALSLEFHETWTKAEAYAEAAVQALHSLGDVMAQIVNLVVLNGQFVEGDVTLRKVFDQVKALPNAGDVADAIDDMRSSDAFNYSSDFANTVKHRKLLDAEFSLGTRPETGFSQDLRFKAFTFRRGGYQRSWPAKTVREIREVVVPGVYQGVVDLGNALNDFLR